jgi:AraC-like DNA-binding protein
MAKSFNNTAHWAATAPDSRMDALLRRIQDPANYQIGLKKPDINLPDSIVLFVRRQGVITHAPMTNPSKYVLILTLRGRGDIILDHQRIHLFPHHALLVFPGQLHYYENLDSRRLTWFYINFQTAHPEPLALLRNGPVPLSAQAWHYGECLARDYKDPERTSFHLASRISIMLWLLLMEIVKAHRRQSPAIPVPSEPNQLRADEFQRYVEERMGKALPLLDLARHMNMSLSTLKNFCRKNLNMGLAQYIRARRLYFACGLMTTTNLTMTEIAAQCGFNSIYTFSRTFKRVMKMSPTAHRSKLMALAHRHRQLR